VSRSGLALIGEFIVDLAARSVRLVGELGGAYHGERARADTRRERGRHASRARADTRRERVRGRLGYRVLRLSDTLVTQHFEQAIAAVLVALAPAPE
jgi:very-short-patch-repair endonuclease